MSTRALYTFKDDGGEYHVYKHHDGYPSGAVQWIAAAMAFAWELPRFEADEFAAAFVAANKADANAKKDIPRSLCDGGVRLTQGATWEEAASSDIEYHYVVTAKDKSLLVAIYSTDCWNKPLQTLLKSGTLRAVTDWARKKENA